MRGTPHGPKLSTQGSVVQLAGLVYETITYAIRMASNGARSTRKKSSATGHVMCRCNTASLILFFNTHLSSSSEFESQRALTL